MIDSISSSFNSISTSFETSIVKPTGKYLDKHPNVYKVVVIANHIFRALCMVALMTLLPYAFLTNCLLTLGASLIYRITIERFCRFRFALPAAMGGIAFDLSQRTLCTLIDKTAIDSLTTFGKCLLGLSPLILYAATIVWISFKEIQAHIDDLDIDSEDLPPCCRPKPEGSKVESKEKATSPWSWLNFLPS